MQEVFQDYLAGRDWRTRVMWMDRASDDRWGWWKHLAWIVGLIALVLFLGYLKRAGQAGR